MDSPSLDLSDNGTLPSPSKRYKLINKRMLTIKDCKNEDEVIQIFEREKFKDQFVIAIKCTDIEFSDKFWIIFNQKVQNVDSVFLQLFSEVEKVSKFYHKKDRNGNFEEITMKIEENDQKLKVDLESIEDFFCRVNELKISLHDVELMKVLKLKNEEEKYSQLEKALRNNNENLVKILLIFTFELNLKMLQAAFDSKNNEILMILLKNFEFYQVGDDLVEIILKMPQIEIFLQFLAQNDEKQVLKILLKNPRLFSELISFSIWCEIRKIALENNFSEFCFELQKLEKENNYFDKLYKEEDLINPRNFPKVLKKLHKNIEDDNIEQIQEFVENYPDFKLCCDENKIPAIDKAIDAKKFEIYSFLNSNSFMSTNKNSLDEKIKSLSNIEKRKIRDFNIKYSRPNPEAYINKICNKCDLFSAFGSLSYSSIRKNLLKLSENEILKQIFECVADADFKVVFDLNSENVQNVDPSASENTTGVIYPFIKNGQCKIIVCRDENEEKQFGTFVHELMHLIFYLLYENKCLPYCEGDKIREGEWNKIEKDLNSRFVQNSSNMEEIIQWVFTCYNSQSRPVELAVRPAHIIARYINQPEKIEDIQQDNEALFNYFYNYVLPDMKLKNALNIIKINKAFKVLSNAKNSEIQITKFSDTLIRNKKMKYILCSNFPQLVIQQIIDEILSNSVNKIDLKAKNIFITLGQLCHASWKETIQIYEKQLDRLFVVADECADEDSLKALNEYRNKLIIICEENLAKTFKEHLNLNYYKVSYTWNELTEDSREKLLSKRVQYQNRTLNASEILSDSDAISSDILKILCSNNIKVNCTELNLKHFIARTIIMKTKIPILDAESKDEYSTVYTEVSLEDFIENIKDDKFVLISDQAGSGKTTVLHKIHELLHKKFPKLWVSFVALKNHIEDLSDNVNESFQDFLIKILKFDALEAKVFKEKFSKGEVRILFDAFDEISPKCKEETLKVFKLFLDENENLKNQILITTRTHLEHDLENELKILAHKLKNLNCCEQTEFLIEIWKDSDEEEYIVANCASSLVNKISEMISLTPSVIGLPLIVEALAESFKSEINKNFEEKIKKLTISLVYEKIINRGSRKIFLLKYQRKNHENVIFAESFFELCHETILPHLQYYAMIHIFDEKSAHQFLGLLPCSETWSLDEISRGEIINYDKDGNLRFTHETYAEYLIALIIFCALHKIKHPTEYHTCILKELLSQKKYEISRMFLNDMLENVNITSLPFLNTTSDKFKDFLSNFTYSILKYSAQEGLFNICDMMLKKLKQQNINAYEEVIKTKDNETGKMILMEILPKIKSFNKFDSFLNEIFCFHGHRGIFEEFLNQADFRGNAILQLMILENVKAKHFEKFIEYLLKQVETQKLKTIFLHRNRNGENFLNLCIADFVKCSEILDILLKVISDRFDCIDIKELLGEEHEHKNILQECLAFEGSVFADIFILANKLENDDKNIKKFILNTLPLVVAHATRKNLQLVLEKMTTTFFKDEIIRLFQNTPKQFSKNLLCLSVGNKNLESISYLWKTFENYLSVDFMELLNEKDNDQNFLYLLAKFSKSKSICEFFWEKINRTIPFPTNRKEYFLQETCYGSNVLHWSAENQNDAEIFPFIFNKVKEFCIDDEELREIILVKDLESRINLLILTTVKSEFLPTIIFLWREVFIKYLPLEKIQKLLYKKSKNTKNIFHKAAAFTQSREVFKYFCVEIKKLLTDNGYKNYLKTKGFNSKNALQESIVNKNKITFNYIFDEMESNFLNLKDFIYECDYDGYTFLHDLASHGSASMLEISFIKLEEKLKDEEIKNFIRFKKNLNLLHCAAKSNTDVEAIKCVLKIIEKHFGKNEIKKMLSDCIRKNWTLKSNYLPLHFAVESNNPMIFDFFAKLYEKHFTNEEIQKLGKINDFMALAESNRDADEMKNIVFKFCYKNNIDFTYHCIN